MAAPGPLSAAERAAIRSEWKERGYGAFGRSLGQPDLIEAVDRQFDELVAGDQATSVGVGADAIAAACERLGPEGRDVAPGVVVYLYLRALHHWQLSMAGWPADLVREVAERLDAESFVPGLLGYTEWLGHGYLTENGLNCSCPVQTQDEAASVAARTVLGATAFDGGGGGWLADLRALLREDAAAHTDYFGTVAALAAALLVWVDEGPTPDAARTLAAGRESLERLGDDSHATNLRPQLAGFAALVESAHMPRLCVESAQFTYIYSFSLLDEDGNDVGIEGLGVRTQLSDVWAQSAQRRPRQILLPSLTIRDASGDELDYRAEIRLGENHSHYARVTYDFQLPADASEGGLAYLSLHIVNQTLRRATASMGAEQVWQTDHAQGEPWTSLLEAVAHEVRRLEHACGAVANPLSTLANDVHVIVATSDVSVQQPDGSWRPAVPGDFASALGSSIFTRAIRQRAATMLEEWLLQPPAPVHNLFDDAGISGELALATANTTVLYMPVSPEWVMADECVQMAEFVASQRSLFRTWERQLERRDQQLAPFLAALERAVTSGADPPDEGELQAAQIALRKLEADIQAELARLKSLNVCRSHTYRSFIDALVAASPIPRFEQGLDGKLAGLAQRHDQLAGMTSALSLRREGEAQRTLELILLVLAVFGVVTWFNDLYVGWAGTAGWRGLLLGLAVAGLVGFVWWRRR